MHEHQTQLDARPFFIERGSTVRVRQRALQNRCKYVASRSCDTCMAYNVIRYGALSGTPNFEECPSPDATRPWRAYFSCWIRSERGRSTTRPLPSAAVDA